MIGIFFKSNTCQQIASGSLDGLKGGAYAKGWHFLSIQT
jgi:hypothetical protein